jgi:hypothetical protein
MADFRAPYSLQGSFLWPEFHASEILEDFGLRHHVVGDAVAEFLGYPVVVFNVYLAITNE